VGGREIWRWSRVYCLMNACTCIDPKGACVATALA